MINKQKRQRSSTLPSTVDDYMGKVGVIILLISFIWALFLI